MNMEAEVPISIATIDDAPAIAKLNLLFNEVDESAENIAARMDDPELCGDGHPCQSCR
jgi:hypothetical protein